MACKLSTSEHVVQLKEKQAIKDSKSVVIQSTKVHVQRCSVMCVPGCIYMHMYIRACNYICLLINESACIIIHVRSTCI